MWERVYRAWQGRGVEFVGVGLRDTREACAAFVRRHGLSFPNGYDGDGRVARAYGFSYQPFWARISREGAWLHAGFGPASESELVAAVRSLTAR